MSQRKAKFLWVNTPQALDFFITSLRGYFPLALDTEADSLHHYRESVCLIQVSHAEQHFLIDPLAPFPLDELWPPTSRHTWILHGADFDLRMLRRAGAPEPQAVFDTMLAAQLIGLRAFGYGALVEQFCGIKLDKKSQKADWSQRPLSPAMIDYAVQDTQYLEPIAEALGQQLDGKGRREWHEQSCARVVTASQTVREEDPENAWRIGGSSLLSPAAQAIEKELWHWREKEAEEADLPVFKVLHNELLLELATWCAEHRRVPPMGAPCWPRRSTPQRAERLAEAIERGRAAPPIPRLPRPERPPRNIAAEQRMERLRAWRDKVAAELELDPTVIAPKSVLQEIARQPETAAETLIAESRWCPWQWELIKPGLGG
ncbi:MAG TPA: HRDC domain-containing protein [Candidatus Methylacidiphilales bacterium]|nr:HRDC domain-containing protein [Candidatus Methylacidiphilales bacterium]